MYVCTYVVGCSVIHTWWNFDCGFMPALSACEREQLDWTGTTNGFLCQKRKTGTASSILPVIPVPGTRYKAWRAASDQVPPPLAGQQGRLGKQRRNCSRTESCPYLVSLCSSSGLPCGWGGIQAEPLAGEAYAASPSPRGGALKGEVGFP